MSRMLAGVLLALLSVNSGCISRAPASDWVVAFGYLPEQVHSIDVGDLGFPYVAVSIAGTRLVLPFDTGNMVGVSVSSALFDQMRLTAQASYDRLNSAGEVVATLRVADAVDVMVLGHVLGPTRVYELDQPSLPGLVGPTVFDGGHITFDYASGRMAQSTTSLPGSVPGFRQLPLVKSSRHPMLILVRGTVEGRNVVLELDTGKSRTVINPALSSDLGLTGGPQGVTVRSLRIGDLSFEVPSAKEVDQTAIDPTLQEPILAGVGSDILSRFIWTVDYDAGVLWIPSS